LDKFGIDTCRVSSHPPGLIVGDIFFFRGDARASSDKVDRTRGGELDRQVDVREFGYG
jgi:hypothetical protein